MFFRRLASLVFVFVLVLISQVWAQAPSQPTIWASKPDVTGFEKIVNDRLSAAQMAIDQITSVKGSRTIENTLAPYDETIRQINASLYLAALMQQVHPDATYRDHATEMVRKASAVQTALSLNRDVYHALASLDLAKADPATRYYVKRQLLEFRLAGVDKDDATRAQLKKLNDELTEEQSTFDRNISDDQKKVEVTDPKELDGLPQDYIDRHKPGPDGKIYITTNYPDAFPVFKFSNSDDLRRRVNLAFDTRAYPANKDVLEKMRKTRYQIATLLGYSSWADYNAADKMIRTGANIADFIQKVDSAARPIAQREFAMLLAEKRKPDPSATEIGDYDVSQLNELVRRSPVLDGIRGKQLPEAILVCNFPNPTADDPGLMEYGDVVTFFHEFGHLMHWILGGQQQWAGISGISMEADFVEAPSQMLEEWMHSPQVLASFARNYKTGEPIPAELVARMNRASAFGRGNGESQQNQYTAISYDIYKDKPENVDPDAVDVSAEKKYTLFQPLPGAHTYASFGHLAGYSSAYYTYLWDKVIAEDFFSQFDHSNLLAGDAPMRYRHTVLEPGGSVSANDLVKNFLGREQNMNAFQKWMGEEFESTDGTHTARAQ